MVEKNSSGLQKAKNKKAKLLDEVMVGLREVKKIREGEARAYAMTDLFDSK